VISLWILLIAIGPFLVATPGLIATAVQAPEFFTGRRPRHTPRTSWLPA
jgi:hypothetical protein